MKVIRFLTTAPVFLAGLLLAIYGVFALTFNEPGGGSTYVTPAGHRLDARLAGGVSLVNGLAIIVAAVARSRQESATRATNRATKLSGLQRTELS